jgi:ribosomal protein S13
MRFSQKIGKTSIRENIQKVNTINSDLQKTLKESLERKISLEKYVCN